jgi:hypothetical protein
METIANLTNGPIRKDPSVVLFKNDEAFKQSMIDMQNEMEHYIEEALAEW